MFDARAAAAHAASALTPSPAATRERAGDRSGRHARQRHSRTAVPEGAERQSPAGRPRSSAIALERWLPRAGASGWLCGVAVLDAPAAQRLAVGAADEDRTARRRRRRAGRRRWRALSRRLHIARRVRLLESTLVDVPTVIGWLKPVVLLPASALAGLTPQQLEAILAHELAHIRRHDYLVNLLQTLVETLLFYHPAVWWLSRRIRIERENCCDDLAVSLCGDPVRLREGAGRSRRAARRPPAHVSCMAATGGSLLQRVRRLLGAPSHAGRAPGWLAGSVAVLLMLGIAAGAVRDRSRRQIATQLNRRARPATAAHGRRRSPVQRRLCRGADSDRQGAEAGSPGRGQPAPRGGRLSGAPTMGRRECRRSRAGTSTRSVSGAQRTTRAIARDVRRVHGPWRWRFTAVRADSGRLQRAAPVRRSHRNRA